MPKIAGPFHPACYCFLMASGKRLVPWLVAVAFFMESLDTTILNTRPNAGHRRPLSK